MVIERSDGVRVDVAVGPSSGRAPLPQQVKSGDRIVVLAAESGQELMFSRIRASLGCPLQADQGGGTTSAGPG